MRLAVRLLVGMQCMYLGTEAGLKPADSLREARTWYAFKCRFSIKLATEMHTTRSRLNEGKFAIVSSSQTKAESIANRIDTGINAIPIQAKTFNTISTPGEREHLGRLMEDTGMQ